MIKSIRFADDQAMLSNSEAGLQQIMNALNEARERYGMKIDVKKTKKMKKGKMPSDGNVSING